MPINSRDTQLVASQAASEANWYYLGSATASAYTQLVAANAERRSGVWLYNQNTVSSTSQIYVFKDSAPSVDAAAMILKALQGTVVTGVMFIPGTGAVWVKSVQPTVLGSVMAIEW